MESTPKVQCPSPAFTDGPPVCATVQYPSPVFTSMHVHDALANQPRLRETLSRAEVCGISIRSLMDLFTQIHPELEEYCRAHHTDSSRRHVCLAGAGRCPFNHYGVKHCSPEEASGEVKPLVANLHAVVGRYIKPWTKPFDLSYAGAVIASNKGKTVRNSTTKAILETVAMSPTKVQNSGLIPEVFISHNWALVFEEFVRTACGAANRDTTVWICAMAINQNSDINALVGGELEQVPFALALKSAKRIVFCIDKTATTLTRVWCVFELHLAHKAGKPIYVSLPDNSASDDWVAVRDELKSLDVRKCKSSNERDLHAILDYVKGTEDVLNAQVQTIVRDICEDASALNAARRGDVENLTQAPRLFCTNVKGQSSFHYAATAKSSGVLRHLLQQQASVHAFDLDGNTALHFAAEAGAVEALDLLIQAKADLHVANLFGETPVHTAAKFGQVEILQKAVASGAKVQTSTSRCRGHLQFEGMEFFHLLEEDLQCGEPLHMAAWSGHAGTISQLVALKANVNSKGAGVSPMLVASARGQQEAARQLLALKADMTAPHAPMSFLFAAARFGQTRMISALLEMRADVNERNKRGTFQGAPALMAAAFSNQVQTMDCLIHAKAALDLPATKGVVQGVRAIHVAAFMGCSEAVHTLVNAKCDVDDTIGRGLLKGSTPLMAAALAGNNHMVGFLLDMKASIHARMDGWVLRGIPLGVIAAVSGSAEVVRTLVERRASVQDSSSGGMLSGCTALIAAAFAGRVDATRCLLELGAETEMELKSAFPPRGATALFAAIIKSNSENVRLLCEAKANIEAKIKSWYIPSGATPLYASILFRSNANTMHALIAAGANIESRVTWICLNARPMHAAALFGNRRAAAILYHAGASLWTLVWGCITPALASSFLSIAMLIIAMIVAILCCSSEITLSDVGEYFPYTPVGILLGCLALVDVPRLFVFAQLSVMCCRTRRHRIEPE